MIVTRRAYSVEAIAKAGNMAAHYSGDPGSNRRMMSTFEARLTVGPRVKW